MRKEDLFYLHTKKCWSNGLLIDVQPTKSGLCKINVIHNGKVIVKGEKFFSQKQTPDGSPLELKVRELYKYYYDKITEKELKNDRVRQVKTA